MDICEGVSKSFTGSMFKKSSKLTKIAKKNNQINRLLCGLIIRTKHGNFTKNTLDILWKCLKLIGRFTF